MDIKDFMGNAPDPSDDEPMVDEIFINYRQILDDGGKVVLDLAIQVDNPEDDENFEVHGVTIDYEDLTVQLMIEALRSLADVLEERYGTENSVS